MCEAIRGMVRKGREEGIKEKAYTTARNMYNRGFSPEEAAGLLEEGLDTVKAWYEEWGK